MKVKLVLIFIASIVQLFFSKVRMIICSLKNKEIILQPMKRSLLFAVPHIEEHLLMESSFHTSLLVPCLMIDGYVQYALIFLETLSKHLVAIIYSVKNALAILHNVHCVICQLLADYAQMFLLGDWLMNFQFIVQMKDAKKLLKFRIWINI
jgi:hypothetical protein